MTVQLEEIRNGISVKMEMSIISIVVPVYNVENYLKACIESILRQNYKTLEIILVDDGSTDRCAKICDDYASTDPRIKVIHKENGGLSDARNTGLKMATGDFVVFVDGDDMLSRNFCQTLIDTLLKTKADVVECGYLKFENAGELLDLPAGVSSNAQVFEPDSALEMLMNEDLKQMVWNKLYRRALIEQFDFPVGKINEDEFWTYKVFGSAKRIARIHDKLYFYRQQSGSIMGRSYNVKRLEGLDALKQRTAYMKNNYPELESLAVKMYCKGVMWHYQKLSRYSEIDPNCMCRIQLYERIKRFDRFSVIKRWSVKEIFWFQFFMRSPQVYASIRNYFKIGI